MRRRATMPKATLEFNLPDENYEFKLAVNAVQIFHSLSSFKEWLFNIVDELDANEMYKDPRECVERVFDYLMSECDGIDWNP